MVRPLNFTLLLLTIVATAALIGALSLDQHQTVIRSGYFAVVLLAVPVYLAARMGWWQAAVSFLTATGAQFSIVQIYVTHADSPLAGMAYLFALAMAMVYLVVGVVGAGSRPKAVVAPI